jgi:hypothetical protein
VVTDDYQHAEHFDLTESDLYVMCRSPVDNPMLFQNHFSIPPEPSLSDRAFSDREYKEPQELEHNKEKTLAAIIIILTNLLHNKAKRLKADKNTVRPLESSSWKVHLPYTASTAHQTHTNIDRPMPVPKWMGWTGHACDVYKHPFRKLTPPKRFVFCTCLAG